MSMARDAKKKAEKLLPQLKAIVDQKLAKPTQKWHWWRGDPEPALIFMDTNKQAGFVKFKSYQSNSLLCIKYYTVSYDIVKLGN